MKQIAIVFFFVTWNIYLSLAGVAVKRENVVYDGDGYHPVWGGSNPPKPHNPKTEGPPLHDGSFADWAQIGKDTLKARVEHVPNRNRAKNVVYFIGDGMGVTTLQTARIHKSHESQTTLDRVHLAWDRFLGTGTVKCYNTDSTVPDSAATATAFLCGEKCREGVLGANDKVEANSDCDTLEGNKLKSVFTKAIEQGKWGGIVTTTRVSHATPAAAFAHSTSRGWEADANIPSEFRDKCKDITHQLVFDEVNQKIRVILGGGRNRWFLNNETDLEYSTRVGQRTDKNMVNEWLRLRSETGVPEGRYAYVMNQTDFDGIDPHQTDYLLGLFETSHMQYESLRDTDPMGEPSLAEMVEKALHMLKRNEGEGFFLFVEGGRIDHAHHGARAQRAMIDTWAFSDAVQKALDMTDEEDTLVVVSADHSHVFSQGGYTTIDSELYGPAFQAPRRANGFANAQDGLPYLGLCYTNGPGANLHRDGNNTRVHPGELEQGTGIDYNHINFRQDGAIPLSSETHSADDVIMAADGPWSHIFTGAVEQSYLATAIAYSACLDTELEGPHCNGEQTSGGHGFHQGIPIKVRVILATTFIIMRRIIS